MHTTTAATTATPTYSAVVPAADAAGSAAYDAPAWPAVQHKLRHDTTCVTPATLYTLFIHSGTPACSQNWTAASTGLKLEFCGRG